MRPGQDCGHSAVGCSVCSASVTAVSYPNDGATGEVLLQPYGSCMHGELVYILEYEGHGYCMYKNMGSCSYLTISFSLHNASSDVQFNTHNIISCPLTFRHRASCI